MTSLQHDFAKRLKKLGRRHDALARGYVTQMRSDGLLVMKPRRVQNRLSPRGALYFFAAFFGFKGYLHADLGALTYEDRVGALEAGTPVEQVGAWLMQADPITLMFAEQIRAILF